MSDNEFCPNCDDIQQTSSNQYLSQFHASFCINCKSISGTIVAPVNGRVTKVFKSGIEIKNEKTNNKICTPITGIVNIINENQTKDKLQLQIYGLVNVSMIIKGKINNVNNDNYDNFVLQGEKIYTFDHANANANDILLDFPYFTFYQIKVKKDDYLVCGETVCATWILKNPILLTVPHAKCFNIENVENDEDKTHFCDYGALPSALSLGHALFDTYHRSTIVWPGNINRTIIDLNRIESRIEKTIFRQVITMLIPFISETFDIHSFPPNGTWSSKRKKKESDDSHRYDDSHYNHHYDNGDDHHILPNDSHSDDEDIKSLIRKHSEIVKCKYEDPIIFSTSHKNIDDIDDMDIVILEDKCKLDDEKHGSYQLLKFLESYAEKSDDHNCDDDIKIAILLGSAGYNDIMDEMQSAGKNSFLIEYNEKLTQPDRSISSNDSNGSTKKLEFYNNLIAFFITNILH